MGACNGVGKFYIFSLIAIMCLLSFLFDFLDAFLTESNLIIFILVTSSIFFTVDIKVIITVKKKPY